jgi:glycerate 2-kinase
MDGAYSDVGYLFIVSFYFISTMHILIAPNAFKNSLDAATVADAIEKGLHRSGLQCTTTAFPVADGGDGTADLLIDHFKAKSIEADVQNPLGKKIASSFGWSEENKTAVIELAAASGLRLLQPASYDPLHATTFGTGELLLEAVKKGAEKILLCIGGSATVDGGTGILRALGYRFTDNSGNELIHPASFKNITDYSFAGDSNLFKTTEIIILCDVLNPLLGINGAAAVFGPQKGATEKDIPVLEAGLKNLCDVILNKTKKDIAAIQHGGAAGGVAAGLYGLLNAQLVNGIDYFLAITGFEKELKKAALVITGEGSIDRQTLQGKAPFGVAKMAKQFSIPVIALAGKIPDEPDEEMNYYFDKLICINEPGTKLEDALKNTYASLEKAAYDIGREMMNDN